MPGRQLPESLSQNVPSLRTPRPMRSAHVRLSRAPFPAGWPLTVHANDPASKSPWAVPTSVTPWPSSVAYGPPGLTADGSSVTRTGRGVACTTWPYSWRALTSTT